MEAGGRRTEGGHGRSPGRPPPRAAGGREGPRKTSNREGRRKEGRRKEEGERRKEQGGRRKEGRRERKEEGKSITIFTEEEYFYTLPFYLLYGFGGLSWIYEADVFPS